MPPVVSLATTRPPVTRQTHLDQPDHKDSHAPQGIHLPGTLTLTLARQRADTLERRPVHQPAKPRPPLRVHAQQDLRSARAVRRRD